MLHIKPIQEQDASEQIRLLYQDIKLTLQTATVPLVFQYLANFEAYFAFIWARIKINVATSQFVSSAEAISRFANQAISEIYTPSSMMTAFITEINSAELMQINKTVQEIEAINAKLFLIMIGIREGIKGLILGVNLLNSSNTSASFHYHESIIDDLVKTTISEKNVAKLEQAEVTAATRMLVPLFGTQSIVVSHYAAFFAHVAQELEHLMKQEGYLSKRVALEQQGMIDISKFTSPLGCSYAEIATFAAGKPYFNELLYILSETFPTQFPRLVFASSIMRAVAKK